MLAINHTSTAIIIALVVKDPLIAAPLALGSHLVLDIIPHHGNDLRFIRGQRSYNQKIALDGLVSFFMVGLAVNLRPDLAGLIVLCSFLSILPDLLWPLALVIKQRGPLWAFFKFHKSIQRETPNGIFIEIVWALVTGGVATWLIKP